MVDAVDADQRSLLDSKLIPEAYIQVVLCLAIRALRETRKRLAEDPKTTGSRTLIVVGAWVRHQHMQGSSDDGSDNGRRDD